MKPFPRAFLPTLFLIIFITIHTTTSQTLISSTCKNSSQTDPNINVNFCKTSLQSAPAAQCATLRGLGTISIRLVRYNITDTRCHIRQLLKNKRWDPFVRQCLSDCFELFSDAIPTVKQAMKYFNGKRFDDANIQISSVMDAANTCEGGFKERKGAVSPLTRRNDNVFQLSAVALSVLSMIQRMGSSVRSDSGVC